MDVEIIVPSLDYEAKVNILRSIDRRIEDISINELCEKCNISKQTFYKYFDSKYSIGMWYSDFCSSYFLYQAGRKYTWHEALSMHFAMLKKESQYLALSVTGDLRKQLSDGRSRSLEEKLHETLVEYKNLVVDDEMEFYIHATSKIIVDNTAEWLFRDMEFLTSEKYVSCLEKCIPEPLRIAIDSGM